MRLGTAAQTDRPRAIIIPAASTASGAPLPRQPASLRKPCRTRDQIDIVVTEPCDGPYFLVTEPCDDPDFIETKTDAPDRAGRGPGESLDVKIPSRPWGRRWPAQRVG